MTPPFEPPGPTTAIVDDKWSVSLRCRVCGKAHRGTGFEAGKAALIEALVKDEFAPREPGTVALWCGECRRRFEALRRSMPQITPAEYETFHRTEDAG